MRLPSATVLDTMRRNVAGRAAAPRRLAALGDPVFGPDDPRVHHDASRRHPEPASAASHPAAADPVTRGALATAGAGGFARLPFTRDEVRAIADLVPSGGALSATDFQASRALAIGGTLADYRIVHFATHGLLNTAHPELSGLVLSLVDEKGRPQDGFLRLQDIYNLHLSADLVVLSACRTALGQEIAGEGFIGLARGFMYAGSPRVVASLWKVDDDATSALMRGFYTGILREGRRPAAALRDAEIALAKDERWRSPYFWAGFTLVGDWR